METRFVVVVVVIVVWLLLAGIEDGLTIRQFGDAIMRQMGPSYSRFRATNIARTEVTNAANGGHVPAMKQLEETGLVTDKRWSSVLDNTTRPAHRALHDVTTEGVDGLFHLDGVLVPFPGHPDLPPENRCGCQCTISSVTVVDALEDAILGG